MDCCECAYHRTRSRPLVVRYKIHYLLFSLLLLSRQLENRLNTYSSGELQNHCSFCFSYSVTHSSKANVRREFCFVMSAVRSIIAFASFFTLYIACFFLLWLIASKFALFWTRNAPWISVLAYPSTVRSGVEDKDEAALTCDEVASAVPAAAVSPTYWSLLFSIAVFVDYCHEFIVSNSSLNFGIYWSVLLVR